MVGEVFLFSGISAWLFFSAAFIFALAMKRNDLADVIWGPGFLVAMVGGWLLGNPSRAMDLRMVLAFLFVGAWAIRLFLHIVQRATSHTAEDNIGRAHV